MCDKRNIFDLCLFRKQVHPLLLALLLPLVPHQVKEEKCVLVRVRQVADCCLWDRTVHLHLTEQTRVGLELICLLYALTDAEAEGKEKIQND